MQLITLQIYGRLKENRLKVLAHLEILGDATEVSKMTCFLGSVSQAHSDRTFSIIKPESPVFTCRQAGFWGT